VYVFITSNLVLGYFFQEQKLNEFEDLLRKSINESKFLIIPVNDYLTFYQTHHKEFPIDIFKEIFSKLLQSFQPDVIKDISSFIVLLKPFVVQMLCRNELKGFPFRSDLGFCYISFSFLELFSIFEPLTLCLSTYNSQKNLETAIIDLISIVYNKDEHLFFDLVGQFGIEVFH